MYKQLIWWIQQYQTKAEKILDIIKIRQQFSQKSTMSYPQEKKRTQQQKKKQEYGLVNNLQQSELELNQRKSAKNKTLKSKIGYVITVSIAIFIITFIWFCIFVWIENIMYPESNDAPTKFSMFVQQKFKNQEQSTQLIKKNFESLQITINQTQYQLKAIKGQNQLVVKQMERLQKGIQSKNQLVFKQFQLLKSDIQTKNQLFLKQLQLIKSGAQQKNQLLLKQMKKLSVTITNQISKYFQPQVKNSQSNNPTSGVNPLQKYPQKGKLFNNNLTDQGLAQHGLQLETLLIAKQYLKLGLKEPSNELILRQKFYYEQKYQLQSTFKKTLNSLQFPFCVMIPSFNNARNKRYLLPLVTLFRQDYQNFHVVYIDDASNDTTADLVQQFMIINNITDQKMILIRNKQNTGSLHNQYQNALKYCGEEQIYMILDGDDGLVGTQTLKLFNHFYQTTDSWFVYANFIFLMSQLPGISNQLPRDVIQHRSYRKYPFMITSHPKTFYNNLIKKMKRSNLVGRDQNGKQQNEIFRVTADLAMVFPVTEMAGERVQYIPQILHIYFQLTQYSVRTFRAFQDTKVINSIRSYPKQDRLDCLFEQSDSCPKASQYIKQKLMKKN